MKKKKSKPTKEIQVLTQIFLFSLTFFYINIYIIFCLAREYYLASSTISLPRKNNNISFSTHTHISTYKLHIIYICIFLYLLKVDTYSHQHFLNEFPKVLMKSQYTYSFSIGRFIVEEEMKYYKRQPYTRTQI